MYVVDISIIRCGHRLKTKIAVNNNLLAILILSFFLRRLLSRVTCVSRACVRHPDKFMGKQQDHNNMSFTCTCLAKPPAT